MSVVSGLLSSVAFQALLAIACVQVVTGLAVVGVGRREASLNRGLPYLVSAAAGVLLATACMDLLPEAVRSGNGTRTVWGSLLGGLLVLFCLETTAHHLSDHRHSDASSGSQSRSGHRLHNTPKRSFDSAAPQSSVIPLLLGSALHSAIDGLAITAAFAAGRRPGWSAAVAVGLHELPHRLGDLSLLLHRGLPRGNATLLALATGAAALVGALAVVLLPSHSGRAGWMLPISAATFLYVALADLIPELHAHHRVSRQWLEVVCLLGGAAVMTLLTIGLGA